MTHHPSHAPCTYGDAMMATQSSRQELWAAACSPPMQASIPPARCWASALAVTKWGVHAPSAIWTRRQATRAPFSGFPRPCFVPRPCCGLCDSPSLLARSRKTPRLTAGRVLRLARTDAGCAGASAEEDRPSIGLEFLAHGSPQAHACIRSRGAANRICVAGRNETVCLGTPIFDPKDATRSTPTCRTSIFWS